MAGIDVHTAVSVSVDGWVERRRWLWGNERGTGRVKLEKTRNTLSERRASRYASRVGEGRGSYP